MQELAGRYRSHGRDVMVIDEDAVWGQRRLDAASVDVSTANPLFQQLLHQERAAGERLSPADLVTAFEFLVGQATARDAVWLQDWSWTDLLAVVGWDASLVAQTSRTVRELAASLAPRVLYLQVDPRRALSRALAERGQVWFNRHAGRPLTAAVTPAALEDLAAVRLSAEPKVLQALTGWEVTAIDAAAPGGDVADVVWQELGT